MKVNLRQTIQRWLQRRKTKRLQALLLQRELIRREGMSIDCTVVESFPTGLEAGGLRLLKVRLKIRLLNQEVMESLAYTFVPEHWRQLKGLPVKVQFANGDLSQVIIRM
jgi:hypothetical protein